MSISGSISSASTYRGWNTQCLRNGLIEVHVVPEITGRFGVFAPAKAELRFVDVGGAVLGRTALEQEVSPLKSLVVRETLRVPSGASAVELVVIPQATQMALDNEPGNSTVEAILPIFLAQRIGC